jgi:hypothetical protein
MIRRIFDKEKGIELRHYLGAGLSVQEADADGDGDGGGTLSFLACILSNAKYNPDFLVPVPPRCFNLRPRLAKKFRKVRARVKKRKPTGKELMKHIWDEKTTSKKRKLPKKKKGRW